MDDIIKLVKTYRFVGGVSEKERLFEQIYGMVQLDLRQFVLGSVRPPAADDVTQEIAKAFAASLKNFRGNSKEEFWAFSYGIARNKIKDYLRKKASDRIEPMPDNELRELMDHSLHTSPPMAQVRHDLEYVMKLVINSRPDCYDSLWKHYVFGLSYAEIANEQQQTYDNVRMKIARCVEHAKTLIA